MCLLQDNKVYIIDPVSSLSLSLCSWLTSASLSQTGMILEGATSTVHELQNEIKKALKTTFFFPWRICVIQNSNLIKYLKDMHIAFSQFFFPFPNC